MSDPAFVEYATIEPGPWKNGRGVTRNLFDDADAEGRWSRRISIAEITGTQPYSPYPGVRRGQVALGPGDVELRVGGRPVVLRPEEIIVFDGEDEVVARPSEPGFLDLNVMTRRDAWTAEVEIADGPVVAAGGADVVVLVSLDEHGAVDGRPLRRLDAVELTSGGSWTIRARCVVARLRRVRV